MGPSDAEAVCLRGGSPVCTHGTGARQGKSDPIDALAVARAAWRERGLLAARLAGPEPELRLLVDHRDD
jgi:hypothetical protein